MQDLNDSGQQTSTVEWRGTSYRTVLAAAGSGGKISIVESVSPSLSGPPRHIHKAEDETFILLTGECQFWIAGQRLVRGPGETVFVPRGVEHTFQVLGTRACRHYTILTPGGFEGFFAEMAAGHFRIAEDMAVIAATAARYNLEFTGPPLEN